MDKKKLKISISVIAFLLIGCLMQLILLINQCYIPKVPSEIGNITAKSQIQPSVLVPHLEKFSFQEITYVNHKNQVSKKELGKQIGEGKWLDNGTHSKVYAIKGIDVKKSVVIADGYVTSNYLQTYNNNYWLIKLPVIIVMTVLIVLLSVTIVIVSRKLVKKHFS